MSVHVYESKTNKTSLFHVTFLGLMGLAILGGIVVIGGFVALLITGAFIDGIFDASGMDANTLDALASIFHRTFVYGLIASVGSFLLAGGADYLDEKFEDR